MRDRINEKERKQDMKAVVMNSRISQSICQISSSRCWSICRELNTVKCFDSPCEGNKIGLLD